MRQGQLHPLLAFGACVVVCAGILLVLGTALPDSRFPFIYALFVVSGGLQYVLTRKHPLSRGRRTIQVLVATVLAPSIVFYGAYFIHVVILGRSE